MSPSTQIWDIVPWYSGLPTDESRDRMVMALQLYVDDSGKNDPPVFVLAGFIASAESWVKFSNEWRGALSSAPALDHFKMVDAGHRNGVFKGFSPAERDERLIQLAEIIESHVEFGVSIAIPHATFNKVFKGKMMKALDTPYALAFYLIQAATHKYLLAAGNREEVDLIFDRQLDREKDLLGSHEHTLDGLTEEMVKRFRTPPVSMDDKRALPLQAADMLAWHIRRSWRDGREKLPSLSSAGPILERMLLINEIWLERDLNHMFEIGMAKVASLNTLPPHAANNLKEAFDILATEVNLEVMKSAQAFVPIEMASFPAIGMEKYLLVRSCDACGNPHLHKRLGNNCLASQTAVEWPPASPLS